MSDLPEESAIERALRDGLAAVPVQEPCAEFDSRILAVLQPHSFRGLTLRDALRQRLSWGVMLRNALRPVLPAAVCSALVMFALLRWTEAAPIATPPTHAPASAHLPFTDRMLEEADLTHLNLSLLYVPQNAPRSEAPPAPHEHADHAPRRQPIGQHAQSLTLPYA